MYNHKCLFLIIFLQLCACNKKEILEWNIEPLFKVSKVNSEIINDTLVVEYFDRSFIFFDDYTKWKTDFFIYINHNNFNLNNLSTRVIFKHEGIDDRIYYYDTKDITELINLYNSNNQFLDISYDMFNKLTPSEILSLTKANNALNNYQKDYRPKLSDLFFDYTECTKPCFASKTLEFIGNMFNETKLEHFWIDDIKVEPCHIVDWLLSLSKDSLLSIKPLDYCSENIIENSLQTINDIKELNTSSIRDKYYSNNYYNEIENSEKLWNYYSNNLENLVVNNIELIKIERNKIFVSSKHFDTDSLDIIKVYIPMSENENSNHIIKVIILSYTDQLGKFKIIGTDLLNPNGVINKRETVNL